MRVSTRWKRGNAPRNIYSRKGAMVKNKHGQIRNKCLTKHTSNNAAHMRLNMETMDSVSNAIGHAGDVLYGAHAQSSMNHPASPAPSMAPSMAPTYTHPTPPYPVYNSDQTNHQLRTVYPPLPPPPYSAINHGQSSYTHNGHIVSDSTGGNRSTINYIGAQQNDFQRAPHMPQTSTQCGNQSTERQDCNIADMLQTMNIQFSSRFSNIEHSLSKLTKMENSLTQTQVNVSALQGENKQIYRQLHDVETFCQTTSDVCDDYINHKRTNDEELQKLHSVINKLESDNASLQRDNSDINDKYLELQSRLMESNLLFFGINETASTDGQSENTETVLREFIKHVMIFDDNIDSENFAFDRVHRLGKRRYDQHGKQLRPRPIVAKFEKYGHRETVRRAASNITDKTYSIREQFPIEIENRRKPLYPVMKRAKEDGRNARLVRDKLYINGALYTHSSDFATRYPMGQTPQYNNVPTNNHTTYIGKSSYSNNRRMVIPQRSGLMGNNSNYSAIEERTSQSQVSSAPFSGTTTRVNLNGKTRPPKVNFESANIFDRLENEDGSVMDSETTPSISRKNKASSPLIEEMSSKKSRDDELSTQIIVSADIHNGTGHQDGLSAPHVQNGNPEQYASQLAQATRDDDVE